MSENLCEQGTPIATEKELKKSGSKADKMMRFVLRNIDRGVTEMPARTRRGPHIHDAFVDDVTLGVLNEKLGEKNLNATKHSLYAGIGDVDDYLYILPKQQDQK